MSMSIQYWTEVNDLKKWDEILSYLHAHFSASRWIFRGLSEWGHELESSFDRVVDQLPLDGADRWKFEAWMLSEFKRRAHHYLGECDTPNPDDYLEWFSLMRHHGAPSRLLDFSYSFFVAAYFAVANARKDMAAAIYCIDRAWLVTLVETKVSDEYFQQPSVFWRHAMRHPDDDPPDRMPFVIPVRPFRSNNRIHVQQGLFLCPADVNRSFAANFCAMGDPAELKSHVFKLKIGPDLRSSVMRELKSMNIRCESLYPGLDGFAGSMRDLIHYFDNRLHVAGRLNDAIRQSPLW
jgi:hypothetical protein